jgi:transcriptional regulator with XRE-family HTH domain
VRRKNNDPIDSYVGERLRLARTMRGLSQEKLAEMAGVTFQQIQKYEKGTNRIAASRLVHFAFYLKIPVGWFFEGLRDGQNLDGFDMDILNRRETQGLIRAYYGIKDQRKRAAGLAVLKSMVD